jgi:osmoprotectant transport system permease protein
MRSALEFLFDPASWAGSDGLGAQLTQQLLLTVTALAIACAIGLPLALWLGHLGRGGALAVNVSNIGRAVPTFAVLVLLSVGPMGTGVLGPYGRAGLATLVSLVLFAMPPIITNAYVGMRSVDREVVKAATGMGMRGSEFGGGILVAGVALALEGLLAVAERFSDPVRRATSRTSVKAEPPVALAGS